jgi:DNA-binding transcriptional ArsR family regulator
MRVESFRRIPIPAFTHRPMKHFSEQQVSVIAGRARALGEPLRVRMIDALSHGEQAVGRLATKLSIQQSTASKHLQVLFHAGLVHRRREASTVLYSLAGAELLTWCRYLSSRQLPGESSSTRASRV